MFPSPSRSSCCQRVGVVLTAMAALSVAAKRSALRRCSAPATYPSPPGSTWPYPYPYPCPCPILVRIRARQRLNQLTARFEIRMPPTAATAASFFSAEYVNSFVPNCGVRSSRIFLCSLTIY